jgi:hypothetical protein
MSTTPAISVTAIEGVQGQGCCGRAVRQGHFRIAGHQVRAGVAPWQRRSLRVGSIITATKPDGTPVVMELVDVITLRDGKVVHKSSYFVPSRPPKA